MIILCFISLLIVCVVFDFYFAAFELKVIKTHKPRIWAFIVFALFYIAFMFAGLITFDYGMESGARKILRKQYTLEYTITQDSVIKDTTIIFK